MAENSGAALDRRFMTAAIGLGAGALGETWPNPAVGAIVVKNGTVVGRGRTGRGGRPHAERIALAQAGTAARGATLYVSLEPCSHHGRTPPCADAVIAAGVARVVASVGDPDPRVGGRGFERLTAAGIEVVTGLLSAEGERAQAGHISRVLRGRPHVAVKLAVSADDAIGRRGEGQTLVTGALARRHVQALRARFDAILVGRGTVEADDPQLTCRLPGLEDRSPVRVVLDSEGRLDQRLRIFDGSAPTWILAGGEGRGITSPGTGEVESERSEEPGEGSHDVLNARDPHPLAGASRPLPFRERKGEGARTFRVARRPEGFVDLADCLTRLAAEGITRVLVEGGGKVARAFLEADLVDEVLLFRSPAALGGSSVPALAGLPLGAIESSERFQAIESRKFGIDRLTRYWRA